MYILYNRIQGHNLDRLAALSDRGSICRRIVIAQSLYAAGAALCFISTGLSIAAIVLVQLNYAISPGFGRNAR